MKPAAPMRGAWRRIQGGVAAVELSFLLVATLVLMPAVALFAKVFFQYSVMKQATSDAATYLATLPAASIEDNTERDRAFAVAAQMVADAAAGAGMHGTTIVAPAYVECDNHACLGLVPVAFSVTATFAINDQMFAALTGDWTDSQTNIWQVSARSIIPFSK
jgi:Flp pilus assembly protein TadG